MSYDPKAVRQTSKFLSLVLRHQPEMIGISLDPQGWVEVADLLRQLSANGHPIDRDFLAHVVATNEKQRFAFSADGNQIRANQGHSIAIDLALEPMVPPDLLFHGTVAEYVPLIVADGLRKMSRQHVHLSADLETAMNVGGRRGKPVILHVQAKALHAAGHVFFCSANGVWLTDHVPPGFIDFP
jgi:putative RNA 2'-phosphotransferase